uniref:TFIIS N-terminal domain-containing protein n=1 Tax=Clastoptera arizonana TaxID=38151 RepID=A0A1B6DQY4_9HEMI
MSEKNIVDQIKHYQRDIDRCPHKSDRMIRCIQRLCVIPVTVQHLQETGIGRSVNSLRKYGGETADAAKALVTKWKAMVAAEESSEDDAEKDELPLEKSEDSVISLNPCQTLVSNNEKSPKTGQENSCNNNLCDSQLTDKNSNKMMKKSRSFSQSTLEFKSSSKNVPNTKLHSKMDSSSKICNSFDNKKERSKGLEIQNHKSNLNIKSNSKCDDHKIHSVKKPLSSDTKSSHKINYDKHNSKSDHKINLKENNKLKEKNHKLKKKHDDKLKTEHSKKHEGKSKQFNLSEEKKRHHQDSSDDESSSIKKKRENPASGKTYIHSLKKKIKVEEESCNENEAESLSEIDEDVQSESSASSDSKRKKSSDSENESMENSTEGSNDESNGSNSSRSSCCSSGSSDNNDSDNVENDQSNQTSDSEKSSDSYSSHDSEHQNKPKKSLKKSEHHSKKIISVFLF